jgi:uncharacterized protein YqhQ
VWGTSFGARAPGTSLGGKEPTSSVEWDFKDMRKCSESVNASVRQIELSKGIIRMLYSNVVNKYSRNFSNDLRSKHQSPTDFKDVKSKKI